VLLQPSADQSQPLTASRGGGRPALAGERNCGPSRRSHSAGGLHCPSLALCLRKKSSENLRHYLAHFGPARSFPGGVPWLGDARRVPWLGCGGNDQFSLDEKVIL
jgi:hypothetical protein